MPVKHSLMIEPISEDELHLIIGMHHGKLINMRPKSVQHSFISTRLTKEKRYEFIIDNWVWEDLDEDSIPFSLIILP